MTTTLCWDPNTKRLQLHIRANGRSLLDSARCAVHNATAGHLEIHGLAIHGADTDMTYDLYLSRADGRKPTSDQIRFAKYYLLGLAEGAHQSARLTGSGLPIAYSR